MPTDTVNSQIAVLLFSDLVDSMGLKGRIGTGAFSHALRRHNEIFESQARRITSAGVVKHTGDGYVMSFATASEAVRFALAVQAIFRAEPWPSEPLRTRMSIHVGEVIPMTMAQRADVVGLAADSAARLMSIAGGGQILLTRFVFNEAREFVGHHPVVAGDPRSGLLPLKWIAHGLYKFQGLDEPMEVFEVGVVGQAPLTPPADGEKARRVVGTAAGGVLPGWRPAIGLEVPGRPGWRLLRKYADTQIGEIWLADNHACPKPRVYQFCFEPGSRGDFGRPVTMMRAVGGNAPQTESRPHPDPDYPQMYESELDETPTGGAPGQPRVGTVRDVAPLGPPKEIGPYVIGRKLGEGGMGEVYAAEQLSPIRRSVALKLIKPGMDTREVLARFDAERQALALMDHPNIARVIDAGADERGRPYFVMEYVAGVPITEYCDQHNLTTQQRLELFIPVCDAIQHSHTKSIIHRDIKPTNVLVTLRDGKPVPVVIDFGVAKAMAQQLTEQRIFTDLGRLIGTPEYISPEQAEMTALDVDTRTDVYSLGVLLYELLTGTLPFDPKSLRSAAHDEMRRIIREVDPPRPSTRLSGLEVDKASRIAQQRRGTLPQLAEELRRELEWIPLKAMRKNRDERYDTAAELGRDVRNYLAGRPLTAGPETVRYKLYKFVRRNRTRVMATAVAAGILLGTVIVAFMMITHQRNEAIEARKKEAEQRARAEHNFRLATNAVRDFFVNVSQEELLDKAGLADLRGRLLGSAVQYFRRLIDERKDDPALREDVAQAMNMLGDFGTMSGDSDGAIKVLEQSLALRRKLAAEKPGDRHAQGDVAAVLNNLGHARFKAGETEPAMKLFDEAQSILRSCADAQPQDPGLQLDYATALQSQAVCFRSAGDIERALNRYKSALAITVPIAQKGRPPYQVRACVDVATASQDVAMILEERKDFAHAGEFYESAIDTRRDLVKFDPDNTQYRQELAMSLGHLGEMQVKSGKVAEGRKNAQEAMNLWQELMDSPTHRGIQPANATAYAVIGWYQLALGDPKRALEAAKIAHEFDRGSLAARACLAHALLFNGRIEEAKSIYRDNRNKPMGDGTTFGQAVQRDFDTLRGFDRGIPAMDEVRAMLSSTAAAP